MTMWRPVSGDIYGLDPHLFDEEAFQRFFAEERVLARGKNIENGHYEIELAVTGRRRRVALLDDDGYVHPGMPLSELVDTMDEKLRKVQIVIEDEVRYGDINLGSVAPDVEADIAVFKEGNVAFESESESDEGEELSEVDDEEDLPDVPLLMLSDLALAEVPALAAVTKVPMAVIPHGNLRAVVAERAVDVKKRIFPRPVFHLTLRTQGEDAPVLTIGLDNQRVLTWTWDEQLPVMDWMREHREAMEFADEHLGAGAIALRCVLESKHGSAIEVRKALLSSKVMGPAFFIQAMGLSPEILDVLEGRMDVSEIPDAEVFKQATLAETLREVIALEISGHGIAKPKLWENYRKLYLDNPGLMNAVASVQAAVGGSIFVGALQTKGRKGRWGAGLGALLMVNSLSRILTTQYIQKSLDHSEAVKKLADAAAEAEAMVKKAESGQSADD
ncbi:hypothetical protein [Flaviflexus huanghaiensis]|uniref:hypothetical protein n=1 Tax=Flaviflexus huanghaiensis TaxID=1111473 RepID=UPI0015FB3EAD|nr:hypothetical protein [Flaviflexus huanghaiensis]